MNRSSHRQRRIRSGRDLPRRRERAACRRAPAERLEIRVGRQGTTTRMRIAGDLDLAAVDRLQRVVDDTIDGVTDTVVFDLRDVSFIDLAGLRLLLDADARARRESFAVHVMPPPAPVGRIFALTNVAGRLSMLTD